MPWERQHRAQRDDLAAATHRHGDRAATFQLLAETVHLAMELSDLSLHLHDPLHAGQIDPFVGEDPIVYWKVSRWEANVTDA